MPATPDLITFANRRLRLCRTERQRFKVSPQIPLEIFLLLGAQGGSIPLSHIYEQIPATEKAIRLHMHSLLSSGSIIEQTSADDKRSKEIVFTQRGIEEFSKYVIDYMEFRLNNAAE